MTLPRNQKARAVFLDRDGVINEILFHAEMGILESPFTVRQFQMKPGVAKAIHRINQLGLKAVVASNQPGVAMKHFSKSTLNAVTHKMVTELKRKKAWLDGIYYCLHHPQKGKGALKRKCNCRKPKAGLLVRAARELNIDLKKSYMVGDSIFDIQAGRGAGCTTFLTAHLKCDLCDLMARRGVEPDFVVKDLNAAVDRITQLEKK